MEGVLWTQNENIVPRNSKKSHAAESVALNITHVFPEKTG